MTACTTCQACVTRRESSCAAVPLALFDPFQEQVNFRFPRGPLSLVASYFFLSGWSCCVFANFIIGSPGGGHTPSSPLGKQRGIATHLPRSYMSHEGWVRKNSGTHALAPRGKCQRKREMNDGGKSGGGGVLGIGRLDIIVIGLGCSLLGLG